MEKSKSELAGLTLVWRSNTELCSLDGVRPVVEKTRRDRERERDKWTAGEEKKEKRGVRSQHEKRSRRRSALTMMNKQKGKTQKYTGALAVEEKRRKKE